MKRRLKNEIYNRKKFQAFEKNSNEAKEFEDSLLKLAHLAKSRVKLEDFSAKDKNHLLDLFVNNERTLLVVYEALFPHRANNGGPSSQKFSEPNLTSSFDKRRMTGDLTLSLSKGGDK
jgi:hypothetical protein